MARASAQGEAAAQQNAIAGWGGGDRADDKAIQIQRHAFRADLDAVGFSNHNVSRKIIGARLANDKMVTRIRRIDANRSRGGLKVSARLYFIELLHCWRGRAWRSKTALGKS